MIRHYRLLFLLSVFSTAVANWKLKETKLIHALKHSKIGPGSGTSQWIIKMIKTIKTSELKKDHLLNWFNYFRFRFTTRFSNQICKDPNYTTDDQAVHNQMQQIAPLCMFAFVVCIPELVKWTLDPPKFLIDFIGKFFLFMNDFLNQIFNSIQSNFSCWKDELLQLQF